ncbi:hypothetical protein [Calorimonas adulescens]|uniref:hypothetical protein n=1 Tax=Calorimonas adulescens TaxID=2606906 RepID=UPI00193AD8EC|nr:hypothetical protein [Calorimonas adulescens]
MEDIKVIIWGPGAMSGGMTKMILEKKGFQIVGAIASRSEKNGKDLGEVLNMGRLTGVLVSNDADEILKRGADIVLLATSSFVKEVYPQIEKIVKKRQKCYNYCRGDGISAV